MRLIGASGATFARDAARPRCRSRRRRPTSSRRSGRSSALTDRPAAAIVIAKAPRPGLCKTRLEPLLGPDGCARLQAALDPPRRRVGGRGRRRVRRVHAGRRARRDRRAGARRDADRAGRGRPRRPARRGDVARCSTQHGGPVARSSASTRRSSTRRTPRAALDDLADGIDVTFGPGGRRRLLPRRAARAAPRDLRAADREVGRARGVRADARGGRRGGAVDRDAARRARPRRASRRPRVPRRPALPARHRRPAPPTERRCTRRAVRAATLARVGRRAGARRGGGAPRRCSTTSRRCRALRGDRRRRRLDATATRTIAAAARRARRRRAARARRAAERGRAGGDAATCSCSCTPTAGCRATRTRRSPRALARPGRRRRQLRAALRRRRPVQPRARRLVRGPAAARRLVRRLDDLGAARRVLGARRLPGAADHGGLRARPRAAATPARRRCLPGPGRRPRRAAGAQLGVPRTVASWVVIRWLFLAGVPADRLARLYRHVR